MAIKVTTEGVDIGIVVRDGPRSLRFYQDVLGLVLEENRVIGRGGMMHRLRCGSTLIKLLAFSPPPPAAASGGISDASGIRYITISVADVEKVLKACEAAGHRLPHPPYDNGHGIIVAAVEDPDGNQVELIQDVATWRGRTLGQRPGAPEKHTERSGRSQSAAEPHR
jgi:catechol 2,3-dioxygenase-like lactoylglutathione lyase family enzyme